jgi:hypothetical protein
MPGFFYNLDGLAFFQVVIQFIIGGLATRHNELVVLTSFLIKFADPDEMLPKERKYRTVLSVRKSF